MVTVREITWTAVRSRTGVRATGLLALHVALLFTPVSAQTNKYQFKPLRSIQFAPPDSLLAPGELQEKLRPLAVGQPLLMRHVRQVIEQLYASGRYNDIDVEAELAGDGVALLFRTRPAAFIRNVMVEGVEEPPSKGLLANATKLQLGQQYSPPEVRQSVESLMEVLRTNGFYLAQIQPETLPQPAQQIDITFAVDPGERAKFTAPVIKGTPNKNVDEIVRAARWKRAYGLLGWKEVTDTRTQQGLDRIRRSYQKKEFLMARVTLDQMEYDPKTNRVTPVISIDSGPKVKVRAKGAKISQGTLRELVPVYQELTVDKDLLVEGQRELQAYMQSRGYFDAQVDFDLTETPDKETLVEYTFFPGDRHKLVFIGIEGNRYFNDETLRERFYTYPSSFLRFRYGRFSQAYLRRDENAIRSLYQTNGFRNVSVQTRVEDDYQGNSNDVAVFFEITEGPQSFVSDLVLEGVAFEVEEELRLMLQSLEQQPYSELNVATDQDTVLNYFYNNGYPDATFEGIARPEPNSQLVSLKYIIRPGERQFVRDVLISGLSTTDRDLVSERIRNLTPGEPLSQVSMIESQRRLYDLGIFARVDTALQNPEGETDHKYVLYRFEEARRYSLTGGFGAQIARIGGSRVTSLDTPAGSAGFSPRISLGISRTNFLGLGHTMSLQTRLSTVQRRALLSYIAPQFKGNDSLNLTFTGLYDDSRDVLTFNSRRQEVSAQLAQRLTKANTAQYRIGYRRVDVSNLNITPSLIPIFSQPINLASVSGTFIQDRRDDPVDARRGIYNTIDVTYASNIFGAPKTTFARGLARNATYHRLGRDYLIARSTSFGVIAKLKTEDIPLPERFFAGGATSHRGFPDNQAGPRDLLTGFPLGGQTLLVNNTELRFPLIGDNIGGVFFHDAGNVYSNFKAVSFRFGQRDLEDFNYMVHALGFGIRYRTPIGPVRIDLAYSINSPRFMGLKGSREQLLDPNLGGVEFVQQRISRFQFHFSLGQLF